MKRYSIELEDGTPLSLDGSEAEALLLVANCGGTITHVQTWPDRFVTNSQAGLSLATYRPKPKQPAQEALELPTMTFVDNGLPELNQEKDTLIEKLVGCGYGESELSSKPLGELRKMAQYIAPSEPPAAGSYSGMGPVSLESQEALPMPVMNFGKEPVPCPQRRSGPVHNRTTARGQEPLPLPSLD
jgi:hypothetical protein